ncbi:Pol I core factor CF [Pestalotiopsis sp. 9143b]|nr:Pol I core factor CF [Pestalotiopsis sp. 9143b]
MESLLFGRARTATTMAGISSYHKMRPGERCEECPTRHWYEQEGLRFCRNGHQLEGFAVHEKGEDEFGTTGRVTRAKKEKQKREGLKLTGSEGRRLYLQALQYVLRRQVEWLRNVGLQLDEEEGRTYEELVKELWSLACAMPGVMENVDTGEQTDDYVTEDSMPSSSGPEDSEASTKSNGWLDKKGSRLPSLMHTLALCYIACVILKQPVTTADFHRWAQSGAIECLAALHSLPTNVQNRMPAMYHRAFQVRDHIRQGRLFRTVQELAVAFDVHYSLKLPSFNYPQVLIQYILDLTLPTEVYLMAKSLIQILGATFDFPDGSRKRIRAIDNPELFLIALVVVSTKLLHSLDGVERRPLDHDDLRAKQINWVEWQRSRAEANAKRSQGRLEPGTEYQVTPNTALLTDEDKMDDFMDWYEKMWVGTNQAETNSK